jgi:hypothetical protein
MKVQVSSKDCKGRIRDLQARKGNSNYFCKSGPILKKWLLKDYEDS